jgi:GNAT superfamily N-acetyltransferase
MIRKLKSESDWNAIRAICCETGNAGNPIEPNRREFFSELWVGPYQKLLPDWTWVATSSQDQIIGYLTGCPDSQWLERARFLKIDLPLTWEVLRKRYPFNNDVKRHLRRQIRLEKSPEQSLPDAVKTDLKTLYPAHLHINLTKNARGNGTGRALTETYFQALRERRIPGVHVICGKSPVPFYERLGFHALHVFDFRPGIPIYCLGIRLA